MQVVNGFLTQSILLKEDTSQAHAAKVMYLEKRAEEKQRKLREEAALIAEAAVGKAMQGMQRLSEAE